MEVDNETPKLIQEPKKPGSLGRHAFPQCLTDAEYMLQLSAKSSVLPNFGGEKGVAPNHTSLERTSKYYNELADVLSEERICRVGSLSQGRWEPSKKLIAVFRAVGSFWQKFGTKVGGILYALPEEGLFLIEQGVFELYLDELPLSVEESWVLLLNNLPSLEYYTVYAFLCRLGFAILTSHKRECFLEGGLNVCSDPTDKQSPRKGVNISHRLSNEELEEQPLSTLPCKYPSSSIQMLETLSSNLLVQVKTFDKERDNLNQKTSPEGTRGELPGKSTERSVTKANCDGSRIHKESLDGQAFPFEKNNMPLVLPQNAVSMDAVMNKLQIIPRRKFGSRSRKLGSDSGGEHSQSSLTREVQSVCYIPNTIFPDEEEEGKVKEEECSNDGWMMNQMMEASRSLQDACSDMGQTSETLTTVPLSLTATDSQSSELNFLQNSSSFSVEQEQAMSLPSARNHEILTKASPSLALSKGDIDCGDVEKNLAQSRMKILDKPESAEEMPKVLPIKGALCQSSSYSKSLLGEAEIPSKALPFLDVYYKTTDFKKSNPGLPDCRVFPCNYNELPLDLRYFDGIFDSSGNIPVRLGLCEQGSVTFYSMIETNVPVVLPND